MSSGKPKDMGTFDFAVTDQADDGPLHDLAKKIVDFSGPQPPDMVGGCATVDVVINEVQVGGASASDEFIELYNPCAGTIDLTGYKLVYRSAAGTSDSTIANLTVSIGPLGYVLVACTSFSGTGADVTYASGAMAAAGGGVALKDGTGTIIDSVGYGTATNAFVEGTATAAPASFQSVARTPNGTDTDHNDTDFAVAATPTPRAQN